MFFGPRNGSGLKRQLKLTWNYRVPRAERQVSLPQAKKKELIIAFAEGRDLYIMIVVSSDERGAYAFRCFSSDCGSCLIAPVSPYTRKLCSVCPLSINQYTQMHQCCSRAMAKAYRLRWAYRSAFISKLGQCQAKLSGMKTDRQICRYTPTLQLPENNEYLTRSPQKLLSIRPSWCIFHVPKTIHELNSRNRRFFYMHEPHLVLRSNG